MPAASASVSANVERIAGMIQTGKDDQTLFEQAPPVGMQRRLGLVKPGDRNVRHRALLVVVIGWVPLVLLTLFQSIYFGVDEMTPLFWEAGAHARYLIAAPLLIIAEAECVPRLNTIVRHFVEAGLVRAGDGRFDAALASTRRLLQSNVAELGAIALAYLVVAAAALSTPYDELPAWHTSGGPTPLYSLAGWWHLLVSLPLLLVLILGWLWRLALWARLLWLISQLDLRLVASHPDHAAGLGFLGQSVRAFALVALAFATVVAGRSAHIVLTGGPLPTSYVAFNVGLLIAIAVLFVAPRDRAAVCPGRALGVPTQRDLVAGQEPAVLTRSDADGLKKQPGRPERRGDTL